MKKSRGIISLILVAAVMIFLGFTCIFGLNSWDMGAAKNINLGLDLEGGVSITYRAVGETPSQEDMDDTVYKLQRRVEEYSTEAQAYQQGDDRISIEIPGVQDANTILEELGQPGSLYFIRQNDSSGNPNYSINADGTAYELTKTIDELEADGSIVLTGNEVESASAGTYADQTTNATQYVVELKLNDEGTAAFADATQEAYAASESIAIYYDGELVSVPNVNNVIENGEAQITGMASYEEAESLASTIRIGGLNVELEEISSEVVGAQLGQEALDTSLLAGAIGLAIVCIFMCFVYLLPGLASSLALLLYTELVLILLNAFDITLTLPGIAGIILGIGMAVDANVIIFARVKEELSDGKSVHAALNAGSRRALAERKRKCQRIRSDTGARYRGLHVHGACHYETDRLFLLCAGNQEQKGIRQGTQEEKDDRFPWKTQSILRDFHCSLLKRFRIHGNQPCARNRGNELQP